MRLHEHSTAAWSAIETRLHESPADHAVVECSCSLINQLLNSVVRYDKVHVEPMISGIVETEDDKLALSSTGSLSLTKYHPTVMHKSSAKDVTTY